MKRRKNKQQTVVNNTDLTKSLNDLSLDQLTSLQNILPNLLDSKIQQMTSSNDLNEIMKANLYLDSLNKRQSSGIKAFFFDPNNAVNAGRGYKENVYYGSLPFSVLRRMGDIFVVRAVVNTRIEQVQNYLHFSLDEQKNGYTIRKKRDFFNDFNLNDTSKEDQKKIEYIKNFLEMGGLNEKWDSFDTFQDFGRKIVFDSLTLDQLAFEITRDNSWNLSRFQAIDASTIRLLDSIDPRCREEFEQYRYKGYLPKYCMVWDGQIVRNPTTEESVVFYPWELGYGVRNKSTSIWKSGYGTSELETLVNILTGILYSFDYNFNYFKQGSMPKGFINVKNPNISNSTLNEFRQAFQQTMRGVSNCLDGSTFVVTEDEGGVKIKDLLKENESEKKIKIWTGKKFENALVYRTDKKKRLNRMVLNNGTYIDCSPDHRFKVISDKGEIEWKKRSEIKVGDYIFTNKKSVSSENEDRLIYKDRVVESDLFEVIGWITGDGWFGENVAQKKRLSAFYHSKKERLIQKRHCEILSKYGINNLPKENFYSEEQKEKLKERSGFNSISDSHLVTYIIDSEFLEWLSSLGFTSSKEGKTIPSFLYSAYPEYRRAFLKGFFSADGSVVGGKYIQMTIASKTLRHQTKMLLLCEGIRTGNYEGSKVYVNHLSNDIKDRTLLIKDNELFFERVGFLQDHKRKRGTKVIKVKRSISQNYVIRELHKLQDYLREHKIKYIGKYDSSTFCNAYSGKDTMTKDTFLKFLSKYDWEVDRDIIDFSQEEVIDLIDFNDEVDMYDIEVYDNEHQFIANGMITHNSHKTPVINGIDLEWIDLQRQSNRDMEFTDWMKFLLMLTCAVYRMDPSELGFQFKDQALLFGQDGQKERLDHSKEKGLKPILIFIQNIINHYIVSEIDENFEFVFTGLDVEDEEKQVALDKTKLESGMVAMQDIFEKYSGRKLDENNDIILNQTYQNIKQAEQQAAMYGSEMAGMGGEAGVEEEVTEDPYVQYEKSLNSNPILGAALEYIDRNWGERK